MDNRRLVLLAALAGIVFLMWQAWQNEFPSQPSAQPPAAENQQAGAPARPAPPQEGSSAEGVPTQQEVASPGGVRAPKKKRTAQQQTVTASGPMITVRTNRMVAEINTRGGELARVKLLKYAVSNDHPNEKLDLLNDTKPYYFVAQSGLTAKGGQVPKQNTLFKAKKQHYQLGDGSDTLAVPLTWQGPDGRTVTKTYVFHRNSYQIELKQTVQNGSKAGPWHVGQYVQFWRTPKTPTENPRFLHSFLGAALYQQKGSSKDYKFRKIGFGDLQNSPVDEIQKGGWVAMDQHYFLAAAIPPSKSRVRYYAKPRPLSGNGQHKAYLAGFVGPQDSIAPGAEHEYDTKLFIGPKLQNQLPKVAPGLGLSVDYGIFTVIAQPVFWVLNKIHGVVGNWGWAIVVITLLIRLAFYKLTEAQYRSMARMKKFGPRMKQIKERFGDDREKMQKAMMDLYKKEGFNPLGGCWPMIIQFPVFIALYWVLRDSVELRQAPWILWIHDLSSPDPYYVLPILYGISMFLQQRLSGNSMAMDDMQRKMMMLMPVGLAVFFTFFPSGLVLYWLVSNLVGIAQQWVITRRVEGAPAKR